MRRWTRRLEVQVAPSVDGGGVGEVDELELAAEEREERCAELREDRAGNDRSPGQTLAGAEKAVANRSAQRGGTFDSLSVGFWRPSHRKRVGASRGRTWERRG